jgi:hypothetical protein
MVFKFLSFLRWMHKAHILTLNYTGNAEKNLVKTRKLIEADLIIDRTLTYIFFVLIWSPIWSTLVFVQMVFSEHFCSVVFFFSVVGTVGFRPSHLYLMCLFSSTQRFLLSAGFEHWFVNDMLRPMVSTILEIISTQKKCMLMSYRW